MVGERGGEDEKMKGSMEKRKYTIFCDDCDAVYSEETYQQLEKIGHNIIWRYDYRRCGCGAEITPLSLL